MQHQAACRIQPGAIFLPTSSIPASRWSATLRLSLSRIDHLRVRYHLQLREKRPRTPVGEGEARRTSLEQRQPQAIESKWPSYFKKLLLRYRSLWRSTLQEMPVYQIPSATEFPLQHTCNGTRRNGTDSRRHQSLRSMFSPICRLYMRLRRLKSNCFLPRLCHRTILLVPFPSEQQAKNPSAVASPLPSDRKAMHAMESSRSHHRYFPLVRTTESVTPLTVYLISSLLKNQRLKCPRRCGISMLG